jgi:AcrR family transcriptional regulator
MAPRTERTFSQAFGLTVMNGWLQPLRNDLQEANSVSDNEAMGKQCLLDQAQRLFLAQGYNGTSVRDIVHACGLSNAALYYHFGSKQNLFVQVFKAYMDRATQQLREAGVGQGSCRERLSEMADAYAQFVLDSRSELQTLHRDLARCGNGEVQGLLPDAIKRIPSLFGAVLAEGVAAGEIRPVDTQRVSILLLGMIHSVAARRMFGQMAGSPLEDIHLAIDILFEGIALQS